MADFAALKILGVLSGGLSGEPELHPRVTFPMEQTEGQRREELFDECDRPFMDIGSFRKDVVPIGVYQRPWINDEKAAEGMLPGLLQTTVREGFETFTSKAEGLYRLNVSPIDQELIRLARHLYSFGVQGYNKFQGLKRYFFGRFQIAQGDFFARVEGSDYLGALRQANRLTDVGFDRLRSHPLRLEAVKQSPLITSNDKKKMEVAMGHFLVKSERELFFWWGRSVGLRSLYDLMHHIIDDCRVIQYQNITGDARSLFETEYMIWTLDSLYLELQTSFHEESCQGRLNVGRLSKAVEDALNRAATLFPDTETVKPRPFLDVVKEAQKRIEEDYDSLKSYAETPPSSEKDKRDKFSEAIAKDHFFMAKQIALNGRRSQGQYPWEEELNRLNTYKVLLTTLFQIQDELFLLKFKIAHRLKGENNAVLAELFEAIDKAEYEAFRERFQLKYAYLKEIHRANRSQLGYWEQLKTSAKEGVREYLFTGAIFDRTPPFSDVEGIVRGHIKSYTKHMRKARELLGEVESVTLQESGGYQDMTSIVPEVVSSGIGVAPSIQQPPSPVLSPASLLKIDQIDLQHYHRFYTPQEYCDFVGRSEFEDDSRIGPAIINCGENCKHEDPHWNWGREKEELVEFRRILQAIPTVKGLPESYVVGLQEDLVASFRKKVVTDHSAYVHQATPWIAVKTVENSAKLLRRSGSRKLLRLIEGRSPINTADNFRDPKFQIIFAARMKWLGSGYVRIDEEAIKSEQRIFTIEDYKNYVENYRFEVEPHIAGVIIHFREQKADSGTAWDWKREEDELIRYCKIFERLEGRADSDSDLVGGLIRELCESFRKKLVTDHSAYLSSMSATYAQQGTALMSRAWESLWRKGARVLHGQMPLNYAGDFRSDEFLARFQKEANVEEDKK